MKKKKLHTLLIDMDCILVDMLAPWIKQYNERLGTNIKVSDIKNYNVSMVCEDGRVLDKILNDPGFFFNDMDPMPQAVEYLQKLIDDGYDVVIVTQPPRKAEYAVRDKRRWMKKYFPDFDLSNMHFCHRKDMVRGDLLFDDKPANLHDWKEKNPDCITATIEWRYNKEALCDWRFKNQKTAWKEFYETIVEHNKELG